MKLSEIQELDEVTARAMRYLRPKDHYKFGQMVKRTFYEVKELQRLFYEPDHFQELIKYILTFVTEKDPDVPKFFSFMNYLRKEISLINEIEEAALSYYPTSDEHRAGVERFAKYGYMMPIDSLAGGDVLKYELIKKVPYEVAFTKLSMEKDRADFDKALFEIRKPRK